ncbi:MAG: homoserine dehydrogenase, partial [Chloroflexi bacterium]
MRLILVGFGVVGQGFAEILRDKAAELAQRHHFKATLVGVATRSRGTLYHPAGLKIDTLLEAIEQGHFNHYPDTTGLKRDSDIATMIEQADADAVLECSYSNFEDAQPALDYCRT